MAQKYVKPTGGIPETDLAQAVRTKLNSGGGSVIVDTELNGESLNPIANAPVAGAFEMAAAAMAGNIRVTPQQFGAVGDGVTDDTNAFQAMFNTGAMSFFVPVGVYKITKPLTPPSNRLTMIGEASHHGHLAGVYGKNTIEDPANTLRRNVSVIFYQPDSRYYGQPMLDLSAKWYFPIIRNIDFFSPSYDVEMNYQGTNNHAGSVQGRDNVSCLLLANSYEISECCFVGFSGYAIKSTSQHVRFEAMSFICCNTAMDLEGSLAFDHRFADLWFCRCNTCVHIDSTNSEGVGKSNHYGFSDIWADQIYGNVIEFNGQMVLRMTDCWFDSIGGYIILSDDVSKSHIVNTTFHRFALRDPKLDSDSAPVPAGFRSVRGFNDTLMQIDYRSSENVPLIAYRTNVQRNTIIAPLCSAMSSGWGAGTANDPLYDPTRENVVFGKERIYTKTDTTLSKAGAPADAQAVGTAIGYIIAEAEKMGVKSNIATAITDAEDTSITLDFTDSQTDVLLRIEMAGVSTSGGISFRSSGTLLGQIPPNIVGTGATRVMLVKLSMLSDEGDGKYMWVCQAHAGADKSSMTNSSVTYFTPTKNAISSITVERSAGIPAETVISVYGK